MRRYLIMGLLAPTLALTSCSAQPTGSAPPQTPDTAAFPEASARASQQNAPESSSSPVTGGYLGGPSIESLAAAITATGENCLSPDETGVGTALEQHSVSCGDGNSARTFLNGASRSLALNAIAIQYISPYPALKQSLERKKHVLVGTGFLVWDSDPVLSQVQAKYGGVLRSAEAKA